MAIATPGSVARGAAMLCLLSLVVLGPLACDRHGSGSPGASIEPEPDHRAGSEPVAASVIVERAATPDPEGCKARTPRGGPSLIPDRAEMLIHLAPSELVHSRLWAAVGPAVHANRDFEPLQRALVHCGQSFEAIEHILVGVDSGSVDANGQSQTGGTLVVTAPNIGRPEVAECLVANIKRLGGERSIATPLPGDPSVQTVAIDDGAAYLFHPDMLVMATKDYTAEVEVLSRCAGYPAIEHSLGGVVARVDTSAPVWFASVLNPATGYGLDSALSVPQGSIRDVTVSARVDQGLTFVGRIGTTDPAAATALSDSLHSMVQMLAAMLPPSLTPAADRLQIEALGPEVTMTSSLTPTEVDDLRQLASP